jgi:tetratricopeptide (TPR) repeat protein
MEAVTEPIEEGPSVSAQDIPIIAERQRLYWLGRGHREAGRLELAIAAFSEYAEVLRMKDEYIAWWFVADLYQELGNTAAALKSANKALSLYPNKAQELKLKIFIKTLETQQP